MPAGWVSGSVGSGNKQIGTLHYRASLHNQTKILGHLEGSGADLACGMDCILGGVHSGRPLTGPHAILTPVGWLGGWVLFKTWRGRAVGFCAGERGDSTITVCAGG